MEMENELDTSELKLEFIVLVIPAETVEIDINAKIYHDGDLKIAHRNMDMLEVQEAINDARRNYIPEDAIFSLTPLGERIAKELAQEQRERMGADEE